MAGALVAQVRERVGMPIALQPPIRDLGQLEGRPLLVGLAGDQQDQVHRPLDRNRRALDGVAVSQHRQVDRRLHEGRALGIDDRPVDGPVVLGQMR